MKETEDGFLEQWDCIKPLFKARFGKKMDVAKIGQVLDNLKMDPQEHVSKFAAKLNTNFSQLRDIIPLGEVVNVPADRNDRTDAVCAGIHSNAVRHTHLQYLKYFLLINANQCVKNSSVGHITRMCDSFPKCQKIISYISIQENLSFKKCSV